MMDRRWVLKIMGAGAAAFALEPRAFGRLISSVVKTTGGLVRGYQARSGGPRVLAFKGISYGADTRLTRFRVPIPVAPWLGERNCTEWAARAPQQSPDRGRPNAAAAGFQVIENAPVHYHLPPDEGPQSEDCLHVNVWMPALQYERDLPVLFYIHGGAYNNGSANAALYDGTRLAERGVVVVTVNHRLNAFGYMYLAGLTGLGERYADSGNVGMLDLVLALKWVNENIAAFGGDPGNVTIFGQSGGGAKCATLMAMPSAKGLFHRVWTMSGQQVWAVGRDKASVNAKAALTAMGVAGEVTAEKLDALTTQQIQAGARTTPNWLPVKDDAVLMRDPFDPDAPAISSSVPMVLGNTKDEIMGGSAWRRAGLTWETLPESLGRELQPFRGKYTTEQIIAAYRGWYPGDTPVDVFVAAVAAFRSWPGQVIEAERRAADAESAKHTWVYQIDWGSPTADGRAPHTIDLAFVFDNVALSPGMVGASERDIAAAQPLATLMSAMLVQFAKTGNPNGTIYKGARSVQWPVYALKDRATMIFDVVSDVVKDPRGDDRRMMAGARYRQPGT